MIRRLLQVIVVGLAGMTAAAQTSIELRESASVKAGAPVTLGLIAEVTGDDAEELSKAVVNEAATGPVLDIGVEDVRTALEKRGVRWGRITLRGRTCSVMVSGAGTATKKKVEAATEPAKPTAVPMEGPETIRMRLARTLSQLYAVGIDDLRVHFDERDAELLGMPTAGRRVDIQPTSTASSSKVSVRVYVFAGDRMIEQRTMSIEVLVRREVVTAVAPIQRRQEVTAADVQVSEQWHAPSDAAPCSPRDAIGSIAKTKINAGQLLTMAIVEAPVIVKKGEIVEVHCLSGSVHLKATRARAMASAKDNELLEFQLEGSKKRFKARMSGRGTAVMVIEGVDVAAAATEGAR